MKYHIHFAKTNFQTNETRNISIPRTTKMSELFGFNSHYCQQITMNSITEIITNEATITGQKSVHDGNLEQQKEKLRSEKVHGYYKLADGEQWIQTGNKSVQDGNFERWNITK